MEEMVIDQVRTLDLEREKRLDATRTLKNSEADLLKIREDLKEVTRARDSADQAWPVPRSRPRIRPSACKRLRGSCRSPRSRLPI